MIKSSLNIKLKSSYVLLISGKSKGTMFSNILKILHCTLQLIETFLDSFIIVNYTLYNKRQIVKSLHRLTIKIGFNILEIIISIKNYKMAQNNFFLS